MIYDPHNHYPRQLFSQISNFSPISLSLKVQSLSAFAPFVAYSSASATWFSTRNDPDDSIRVTNDVYQDRLGSEHGVHYLEGMGPKARRGHKLTLVAVFWLSGVVADFLPMKMCKKLLHDLAKVAIIVFHHGGESYETYRRFSGLLTHTLP